VPEQAKSRVADCLVTRGLDIARAGLLFVQMGEVHRIVGGPGIPHRDRKMMQIAGMHWRAGLIVGDGIKQLLLPLPRHGVVGLVRRGRCARNDRKGKHQ